MNFKLEWNKIVINALSVLVATIIVGAACIVWERAGTASQKIDDNAKNVSNLIETLSEKLAGYEVQMSTMSNQLSVLINNQAKLIQHASTSGNTPVTGFIPPKSTIPDPSQIDLQQKASLGDMMKQFKK